MILAWGVRDREFKSPLAHFLFLKPRLSIYVSLIGWYSSGRSLNVHATASRHVRIVVGTRKKYFCLDVESVTSKMRKEVSNPPLLILMRRDSSSISTTRVSPSRRNILF